MHWIQEMDSRGVPLNAHCLRLGTIRVARIYKTENGWLGGIFLPEARTHLPFLVSKEEAQKMAREQVENWLRRANLSSA